ncbi:DUF6760 family protein [Scytonema hofmannii]|uniref:DUF6760 family protein n=1 Tax=Scytonema hofmannii TaxID=34078 RepID=UPI000345DD5D|nr:DUF6760 family protein [Scytonema hofmannii]
MTGLTDLPYDRLLLNRCSSTTTRLLTFQCGVSFIGGVIGYPLEQLHEEVACIAYHFHWSLEDILNLEHDNRRHWVTEIAKIKQ